MALTIPEIVVIAKISQYLALTSKTNGKVYNGGNFNLIRLLYMVRKNIEWAYDRDSTDDTLIGTGNYLLALCAPYRAEAQRIANISGGGSIASVSQLSTPERIDFLVSASSYLPTGTTTFTFPSEWQGYNMEFIRGGVPQTTVVSEGIYFSWDMTTRIFTCFPALGSDELIAIIPV